MKLPKKIAPSPDFILDLIMTEINGNPLSLDELYSSIQEDYPEYDRVFSDPDYLPIALEQLLADGYVKINNEKKYFLSFKGVWAVEKDIGYQYSLYHQNQMTLRRKESHRIQLFIALGTIPAGVYYILEIIRQLVHFIK